MKYLMSLQTKTQQSINKNKNEVSTRWLRSISLNGGHRPLYPFFGKSQAWMKINLLQPNIDKTGVLVYYGDHE